MKREMFYYIVSMLGSHITRQDTNMGQAIPPDKRVAMAIVKLASSYSLCYIANQFGMAACTVRQATGEVCQLLKDIAANKIIYLVNLQQVTDDFNEKGFPNCVGALDSTHIPLLCPAGSERTYTNRKGHASMILQAVVDHRGWFTYIHTRWTGSVHDVRMFRNSPLTALMEEGHCSFGMEETVIRGVTIPPVIFMDAGYPLKPSLMKPYGGSVTNPQKLAFNHYYSSWRTAVECVFD
ncbi:hypothetical protein Y1Q_0020660 [Alligator mississippiensis]|uniref:DDE Tnp4 domain-containing protein n=1 Tax=Alligator mississippiensis TaxID=8496 RepID=A0A151NI40_ALLMI|nr:hypothetical protein Y1Q_0020660 [Alligator mississippiensis]